MTFPADSSEHSSGRYYRPELDVLRFGAFLLIFLHHALPNGEALLRLGSPVLYAAVDACRLGLSLFFTLSAFLICELLCRERAITDTVGIKRFYVRRILRIWPLYYLALALGVLVAVLPGGSINDVWRIGWFAIFLGAWTTALHGWLTNPVSALWSISVEEQFYLLAPWMVKFCNRKAFYGFSALVLLGANVELYHLGRAGVCSRRIWTDSFVQFECFAAGIFLCLLLRGGVPQLASWLRTLLFAVGLSCWMGANYGLHAFFITASQNPGSWALMVGYQLAALGCVCLIVAFLGFAPQWFPGWAIYLGRISYGLYVYHQFALYTRDSLGIEALSARTIPNFALRLGVNALLTLGLPFTLTLLLAVFSYRYVETPFLKLKSRYAAIESQPIAGFGWWRSKKKELVEVGCGVARN